MTTASPPATQAKRGVTRRTDYQKEVDMVLESRLLAQGMAVPDIRHVLNPIRPYVLTPHAVVKDVEEILARWRSLQEEDAGKHIANELMKINALEMEYWDAWAESKKPKQQTTSGTVSTDKTRKSSAAVKTINKDGDPRYLDGVARCIEMRCRLLELGGFAKANLSIDITQYIEERAVHFGRDPAEAARIVSDFTKELAERASA